MIDLLTFEIDEKYLAHTPNESLIAHSKLTKIYLDKILKVKGLEPLLNDLIGQIDISQKDFIKKLFINAIYLHDIGKKNPYFQAIKMKNQEFKEFVNSSNSTRHSIESSKMYIEYFLKEIENIKSRVIKTKLQFIIYSFAYQISKHHSKVSIFKEFQKSETIVKSYFIHLDKLNIPPFEFYILNKLLFSLLISSDFYATSEYMSGEKFENFGIIKDIDKLIEKFENYQIVKNIREKNYNNKIDKLRSEMFLEAENNLNDSQIFYLEAPTGSGKTLTSINLALNLSKQHNLNKIFYIFPFNTLVEQSLKTFENIFEDSDLYSVINSLTPIVKLSDEECEDIESKYQNSYFDRLFFNSPIILTTHVRFFNTLFGLNKEDNFPLWQFANSVIIIDEIQSYSNDIWWEIIEFLNTYSKTLNLKIIIMSATLPKLDRLLEKEEVFTSLIKDRDKFFKDDIFKERVKLDFSLLKDKNKKNSFDELIKKLEFEVKNYNKILFEFITKKSAREFFNLIKDKFKGFEIYELSGDDNKAFRDFIINKIKNIKEIKIIIVATQVIEAGVDIDMDLGFKDIATLDSEEQFLGRINRNCLKESAKAYFFDLDDEKSIYKKDNRLEFSIREKEFQNYLREKEFEEFYKRVLNRVEDNKNRVETFQEKYKDFNEFVQKLNYKEIYEKTQLIKARNFQLYIPFTLDISKYNIKDIKDIKEFLSGKCLNGQKVWDKFKSYHEIEHFPTKKVKLSEINSLMQFFTFNLSNYDNKKVPPHFKEEFKGYFLVDSDFITDECKFDREAYLNNVEGLFV